MSSFYSRHVTPLLQRAVHFWREQAEPNGWPRWVLCRTRRQARATAILYGIAFVIVTSVAVRGFGSARILLELLLVAGCFVWSLAQLRHVVRAERQMAKDVQRTIDSLPGTPLDG